MEEKELYTPVKKLFTDMGYTVKGEIKDVDLVATMDDMTLMVEFKLQLGFRLVLQAVDRQKITEYVYVAIPKPTSKIMRSKSFKEKLHLLRRLELGLIYVSIEDNYQYAQIIEEPRPYNRSQSLSRNKGKKKKILQEMKERHGDYNVGGSKGKVMTVYKEQALYIAYCLKDENMSPKALKALTGYQKTPSILQRNFYKWYVHIDKGLYGLSDEGKLALKEHSEMIKIMNEARKSLE